VKEDVWSPETSGCLRTTRKSQCAVSHATGEESVRVLICVQAEPEPKPEKLLFIHLEQYGLDNSVAVAEFDIDGGKRVCPCWLKAK
jgi:hypothetical protein